MKRWDVTSMLDIGRKLFAKIHKQKKHANPNHDVHFMAREIDQWLPQGIQALIDGTYDPRCLKRIYFPDEMVDQVHLSDRILQHILLKIIKPTFKHVMNPNCLHLHGPSGVQYATERIKQVLEDEKPAYFIRADIKSYYRNIPHYKLIQDIKQFYDDPKLIAMLENIITNPIDTPYGYKNPVHGIALRGPLSQFFSGIYLKPLDDALSKLNVTYIRFQDDWLILCKTKRQMQRAWQRMGQVLHERRLTLSRKKSRKGSIADSFHFLGIHYQPTQTEDNTSVKHANDHTIATTHSAHCLVNGGGGKSIINHQQHDALRVTPHPRTLRKARENVRLMVADGLSAPKTKNYFLRWVRWWVKTANTWDFQTLVELFISTCWYDTPVAIATAVLSRYLLTELDTRAPASGSIWAAA